jgi:predicted methyltransferase
LLTKEALMALRPPNNCVIVVKRSDPVPMRAGQSSHLPARRRVAAALAVAPWLPWSAALGAAAAADGDGAQLRAVLAGAQRSEANRARDAARHPFETLRFFGLAPGQSVVEVSPGGGWYTEILAPYLREHGRLYAAHYAKDAATEYQRKGRAAFDARLTASPAVYDRVVVGTQPDAAHGFVGIAPPGGADLVLTFRNLHNWIEAGHLDESLRAFHAVLERGGVLGVEEHRAAPGTPLQRIIASGYVPEALVIERARAAGFELAGRSEVNANPLDTKDHPNGVWSLPPVLRGGDLDRARYLSIGESDRMTLKFVKRQG